MLIRISLVAALVGIGSVSFQLCFAYYVSVCRSCDSIISIRRIQQHQHRHEEQQQQSTRQPQLPRRFHPYLGCLEKESNAVASLSSLSSSSPSVVSDETTTTTTTTTTATAITATATATKMNRSTIVQIRNELLLLVSNLSGNDVSGHTLNRRNGDDGSNRNGSTGSDSHSDSISSTTTTGTSVSGTSGSTSTSTSISTSAEPILRRLEYCINTLEDNYSPCQTLSFLNLLMHGVWQFVFTTHVRNRTRAADESVVVAATTTDSTTTTTTNNPHSSPQQPTFRIRTLQQTIQTLTAGDSMVAMNVGNITNTCIWEWNQPQMVSFDNNNNSKNDEKNSTDGVFDCYGTFTSIGQYMVQSDGRILQCAVMGSSNSSILTDTDNDEQKESLLSFIQPIQPERILQLLPKSTVPHNVTQLLQNLQRTIPHEIYDMAAVGYDITYMDDQIRIVRYHTPKQYESRRNIFVRCME
jgi:hypothetical protein